MEFSKNIIKKLTIEVDTKSMTSGLQIKNDINGFLQKHIYPKLEHYFNQNIPKNELWKYENIQLEIDVDSEDAIKDITPKLISKLEHVFKKEIPKNQNGTIEEITSKSAPQHRINGFLEFLEYGQYPWWFDTKNKIAISDFKVIDSLVKKEIIISKIIKTNCLDRLIHQFDYQFIIEIYCWLFIPEVPTTRSRSLPSQNFLQGKLKRVFWTAVFSMDKTEVISFFKLWIDQLDVNTNTNKKVFRELKKENIKKLKNLLQFCNKTLQVGVILLPIKNTKNSFEIALNPNFKKANSENLIHISKALKSTSIKGEHELLKLIVLHAKITSKLTSNLTQKLITKELQEFRGNEVGDSTKEMFEIQSMNKEDDSGINTEGTLIEKAGLVLLHPFLKHFFMNMELLSENKIHSEKRDLAVHLLHYIATKGEQPSEHELIFEKYICNIPVNHPIDRFIRLTSEQKNSCDELLQAVLKHWSELRTNSIDALRSEFLLRPGKLTTTRDKHRLFIQRNTQDILLDTLPWNLHMVKLPWKKQLLYVEW
ncbi:MAG: hypothetical protein JKY22_09680 [Flavobacteriaceae bacterium]|nr:hypothetical protein [Flavobacteriaceae bacterium]